MEKNELMEIIKSLELQELEEVKKEIDEIIKSRKIIKKIIYTHDCFNESNYHKRKYKHWAKELTGVDDSKTNGFAFQGDFLKVDAENLVNVGSYVVECCSEHFTLYLVKENEKEFITDGRKKEMVSFIQEVKEIANL